MNRSGDRRWAIGQRACGLSHLSRTTVHCSRTSYHASRTTHHAPRITHHLLAFTLVELLVVVALIGLLAALLFPALGKGKSSASRIKCLSNLRQLSLAAQMYWDEN